MKTEITKSNFASFQPGMLQVWMAEIFVYLLALLLFYTAGSKIINLKEFSYQVRNQPFSPIFTPYLTYGVPIIELVLMLGLFWPKTRLKALYGTAALLTIFTIYIALVTFNYYGRVPCGCAFGFENISWPAHLILNFIFTAMAYYLIYFNIKNRKLQ